MRKDLSLSLSLSLCLSLSPPTRFSFHFHGSWHPLEEILQTQVNLLQATTTTNPENNADYVCFDHKQLEQTAVDESKIFSTPHELSLNPHARRVNFRAETL